MDKVLVTGALGFIGYHTCLYLASKGYSIVGLDNASRGRIERKNKLEEQDIPVEIADIRDNNDLTRIFDKYKPDMIVHAAALISVDESFEKPLLYEDVNARGTITLVLAANKYGAERFVYISSAAVYGNPVRLPISEDHPVDPLSPYGASKLAGEYYVKTLFGGNGGAVTLRLFNVYGLGQNPEYAGVISKFLERLAEGKPPIIFGTGEQTRDFIHVEDVARAIEKALTIRLEEYMVFNIGTGKRISIRELAELMIKLFGLNLEPVYGPPRRGDIMHSYADISRAKRILGWHPSISLEEGLKKLIETYRG